jgi:hypothetical protein
LPDDFSLLIRWCFEYSLGGNSFQAIPIREILMARWTERLAKLRDSGALTEDEFVIKKTELLARL